MRDYGLASYWDQRYAADEEGAFDWYQGWETLERYLKPFLSADPDFEVLIPGCGNSRLGAALYDAGYMNITNVDSSSVVISQMTDRYADKEEMECKRDRAHLLTEQNLALTRNRAPCPRSHCHGRVQTRVSAGRLLRHDHRQRPVRCTALYGGQLDECASRPHLPPDLPARRPEKRVYGPRACRR